MTLRRAVTRVLSLFRKRTLERELEQEILAHLELAERDAIAAGLTPEEARQAARRSFGGMEQMKEDHRDSRGVRWLENLVKDFRHGMASLVREPGFAAVAIGVLALGIGANTAMFSVVDAVLLRPVPFPEPDRMVNLVEGDGKSWYGVSALNFVDWRRLSTSFEALSAATMAATNATVMRGGEPERWVGALATVDFFKVFGTQPLLGRTFSPGEDQPGADHVIVLSHSVWQDRFGGRADILGRDVLVDGEPHRIIGVLPAGVFDRESLEFWKPLVFKPDQLTRESMWLSATGRLRPGVSLEQAREEMRRVSAGLEAVNPYWKKGWTIKADRFGQNLVGDQLREMVLVVFGAVLLVLLIACSNVANLLLARGAGRTKEMAVRAALGASRGRLVAQLLAESLALCTLGGAAGVALAYLLVRAARPLLTRTLPFTSVIDLNSQALLFAGGIALGVTLLVGLLPSLRTSADALGVFLNQASRGSSGSRSVLRRVTVVGEVAVSLVLVCGAALMFRTLLNLQKVDAGVRIDNVITTSIELPSPAYPTPESAVQFVQAVQERLEATPGVERATVSSDVPMEGLHSGGVIIVFEANAKVDVGQKRVDPQYFRTLDIPVQSGRGFTGRDRLGATRVVIVNQELARRLSTVMGGADPVGKIVGLTLGSYGKMIAGLERVQIAGVIRTERVGNLYEPERPIAYSPLLQEPDRNIRLIVRTRGDSPAVIPAVREAVRQIDPRLPLGVVRTMQQVKERSFTGTTQSAWVIGAFAVVAALLAAFGLYGVLAQAVMQQRREIGIRMALGAGPRAIVFQVLRSAGAMVAVGLVLGLAGAVALTGLMQSLLFQVSALDPGAFVAACAAMTLVGLLATLLPANRAARVDPVRTLREEG